MRTVNTINQSVTSRWLKVIVAIIFVFLWFVDYLFIVFKLSKKELKLLIEKFMRIGNKKSDEYNSFEDCWKAILRSRDIFVCFIIEICNFFKTLIRLTKHIISKLHLFNQKIFLDTNIIFKPRRIVRSTHTHKYLIHWFNNNKINTVKNSQFLIIRLFNKHNQVNRICFVVEKPALALKINSMG